MKLTKKFFFCVLPIFASASLVGCNNDKPASTLPPIDNNEEDKPLEIGDTVREWCSSFESTSLPIDLPNSSLGKGEIDETFGHSNSASLRFEIEGTIDGYVGSDVLENRFFLEDDAKNGDIISLYVYVPLLYISSNIGYSLPLSNEKFSSFL